MGECSAHFESLRSGARAMDGIAAMLRRVVGTADRPCLGVSSIYEFGTSRRDLADVNGPLGRTLHEAIAARVRDAQREGDAGPDVDPATAAQFLVATIASIRVAGRGGADQATLSGLADMALRALR